MNGVGVCSWSLRAGGPQELARKVCDCGLDAVQIALDPIRRGECNERETIAQLQAADITLLSGMMAMRGMGSVAPSGSRSPALVLHGPLPAQPLLCPTDVAR